MSSRTLASWEARLRPLITCLPPSMVVRLYSHSRRRFVGYFSRQKPRPVVPVEAEKLARRLWDLDFRVPIFNAAGMFKAGPGYELVARQGAGAFLAGTTTHRPRKGNQRHGVKTPFAPYPRSGAASNWLGLPNPGHTAVANQLAEVRKVPGCPLGVSVTADPIAEVATETKLQELVAGMQSYEQAGVDFLEMNESCPNTEAEATGFAELVERLEFVADRFLDSRQRKLPVIVKFSNDTEVAKVPELLGTLGRLGFDGVNFGNTSVAYPQLRTAIQRPEQPLYDHFVRRFGGGVSGRPLRQRSLDLCQAAVAHLKTDSPTQEFHVLRTGGVESAADLHDSEDAGVALSQWYTGYFEAFASHGHQLYQRLLAELDF